MKMNSGWVKTDYKVQTLMAYIMGLLILGSALICLFSREFAFLSACFVVLFLMPVGAWQVISGLFYAFKGDRLQQIYLGVVIIFWSIWYAAAV